MGERMQPCDHYPIRLKQGETKEQQGLLPYKRQESVLAVFDSVDLMETPQGWTEEML